MQALKVLHLPVNIASQVSVTVRALRDIGVTARGLVLPLAPTQSPVDVELMPVASTRTLAQGLPAMARRWRMVVQAVCWSDVVHWHFGRSLAPLGLDIYLIKILGKASVVEFWGSDIRIPEVAASDNPYVARLGKNHEYGDMESYARSRRTQSRFARAGFECLVSSEELLPYVQRDLFPQARFARQRVLTEEYAPRYPNPHKRRPLVVHSTSARLYKGTPSVVAVVERLQRVLDLEFVVNHHRPRAEALKTVGGADIFLDQFLVGGYGLAAVEAMAFGKPVVCYVKPSLESQYPPDLPIVNANQDNLSEVLERLVTDGRLRREIGKRGRAYAEKHHDAHKIAHQLLGIYEELLSERRRT